MSESANVASGIEIVGWKCFTQRSKKGQYDYVGLLQFDSEENTE